MVALLSRELLPLGTVHASDLDGPFHTLRHPRLSDMAARAFVVGLDAKLPKLASRESAEIGSRNSLLRRYAGGGKGPLPDEVSAIAARAMHRLKRSTDLATLIADWRRGHPRSEALNSQLRDLRADPSFRALVSDQRLTALGRLYGGKPLAIQEGPQSLARAKRMSVLYLTHFHHAIPFDRGVLRAVWESCPGNACARSQRQIERELGKIDVKRSENVRRQDPGAIWPAPNESTEGKNRFQFPASD